MCSMFVAFANPQDEYEDLTDILYEELWWAHYMLTEEDIDVLREFSKKNGTNLIGSCVSDLLEEIDAARQQ